MPKLPDGLHYGDKYNIYQDIDLTKHFGVDLSDNAALRSEIGQALIDKMVERTEQGKDIWGRSFDKYSSEYIDSDDFKDADKSASKIDMTLTGDMLSDVDIIEDRGSQLRIGFTDSTNQKKAANHSNGVTVPKRFFFGLTSKDINDVKKEFSSEINKLKKDSFTDRERERFSSAESVQALFEARASDPRKLFEEVFKDLFGDDRGEN